MSEEEHQILVAYVKTAELLLALGHTDLSEAPGILEIDIDKSDLTVVANGHGEPLKHKTFELSPCSFMIFHKDFPVAILGPSGGACIAMSEDELIEELDNIKSALGRNEDD